MEFFSLLIVLGLLQLWGSGGPVQRDQWFYQCCKSSSTLLPSSWSLSAHIRLLILVASPVLLLMLLMALLDSFLFGLPLLMLTVLVLLFSLGRGDFNESLRGYLNSWKHGNIESAYEKALSIGDFEQGDVISDYQSLHEHVRQAFLYEGFERWFAVVFWFLLLGPVAALGYRLSYLLGRTSFVSADERQLALRFVHYLDWLPARLLVLSFALTGNFVNGFNHCWQQLFINQSSVDLLDECAVAAINSDGRRAYPAEAEQFIEYGREELLALQDLLSRSVICWVVVVAIITIL